MSTAKIEDALQTLGLSSYEQKAYLALLNNGRMTAKQICDTTDIPYSKIHTVLKRLEHKGWIEVQNLRPAYYYPKPPQEAVKHAKQKIIKKIDEASEILINELQPVFEEREIKEKPDIWIIYGENNVINKVSEVITNVKDELLVALPYVFDNKELINVALVGLKYRRVKVKVLTTKAYIDFFKVKAKNVEIRYRDTLFGGGIIADGSEVILFVSERKAKIVIAIWSKHTGLTTLAKEYFTNLWETAKKVEIEMDKNENSKSE